MKVFDHNSALAGDNHGTAWVDWRSPDQIAMEQELDDDAPEDVLAMSQIPPDALRTLVRFLLPADQGRITNNSWPMATKKLAVLAHALNLPGLGELSLARIAEQLGCTRASLSNYAVKLADQLGDYSPRNGKPRPTRETYRQAAIESHARRGHVMGKTPPVNRSFGTIKTSHSEAL